MERSLEYLTLEKLCNSILWSDSFEYQYLRRPAIAPEGWGDLDTAIGHPSQAARAAGLAAGAAATVLGIAARTRPACRGYFLVFE